MSPPAPGSPDARPPRSEGTTPSDIKLKRAEQWLIIRWADGHTSVLEGVTLRRNCPCARCRQERQSQEGNPLRVLSSAAAVEPTLTGAELMGHYALKLVWSDGHDTGIFEFRYLRSLDPT